MELPRVIDIMCFLLCSMNGTALTGWRGGHSVTDGYGSNEAMAAAQDPAPPGSVHVVEMLEDDPSTR